MAQQKGLKVVQSAFLGGLGAKPEWRRKVQKLGRQAVMKVSPKGIRDSLGWDAFRLGDACIAMTEWEAHLLRSMYDMDPGRVHVIPNGAEDVFLEPGKSSRGEWLVCTSTIVELKQMLKLAQAAVRAKTPLWVIGRPFSPNDPYALEFQKFARENSKIVRYEGPISSRPQLAEIYRTARGFVLLSKWESLSLSALEAVACGCPLLLSDLPWAKTAFGTAASYCGINASLDETAKALRKFYDSAPELPVPSKPLSWDGVAQKLKAVYEGLLKTSP
jgi:glycosyltransferase involved in cell wall biosynthesis